MIDIIDYNNDSSQFEKFVNASSKSGKKNKDVLYRQHCYYFRMINLLPNNHQDSLFTKALYYSGCWKEICDTQPGITR